jgi:pyruvate formate lyase activating enzyme
MEKGTLFNLQRFAVNDGPGIRTTLFFKGCPLRCTWCHNPESQLSEPQILYFANRCIECGDCIKLCPNGALEQSKHVETDAEKCALCGECCDACGANAREIAGREMDVTQAMHEIIKDSAFFQQSGGGVTFSGGEPLAQSDFLLALLQRCNEDGIHSTVDTCGYAAWTIMQKAAELTNLFLYDLKIMDDARHIKYTSISNKIILENLRRLARLNTSIIVRVPIIPGITDDEDNLSQIVEFVSQLSAVRSVDLLPFHNIAAEKYRRLGQHFALEEIAPTSEKKLTKICQLFRAAHIPVSIGG